MGNNIGRGGYKSNLNPRYDTSKRDYELPKEDHEILEYLPGVGDMVDFGKVLDNLKNNDYISAIIGSGLLILPNIIEKPIEAVGRSAIKALGIDLDSQSKILKNYLDSHPEVKKQIFESQNQAVETGAKEVFKQFNGDILLRNLDDEGNLLLNSDIAKRYDDIGVDGFYKNTNPSIKENTSIIMVDNPSQDNRIGITRLKSGKDPNMSNTENKTLTDLLSKSYYGGMSGYDFKNETGTIAIKRYINDVARTPEQLVHTGAHEATHLMQNKYMKLSRNPTVMNKLQREGLLSGLIKDSSGWASNIDEIQSDLWGFRISRGIGGRDLSDLEASEFLNSEYGSRHFKPGHEKINTKLIKVLPTIAGLAMFNQLNSNQNDKI